MTNQNLVPAVIVDRNGKTTTVHRKPNTPVKEPAFAKPVLPEAKPTEKMTGEEIAYTIIKRIKNATPPNGYEKIRILPLIRKSFVEASEDRNYIRSVHSLLEALISGEPAHYQVATDILYLIGVEDKKRIRVLYSNQDILMEKPGDVLDIANFASFLISSGAASTENGWHVPSLKAHLKARQHYRRQHRAQFGGAAPASTIPQYRDNLGYMEAVESNYEKIDKLIEYRNLRGINIKDGREKIDAEDFRGYLKQGAVSNGWL